MKSNKKGFTIVELVIVIAVIAILAGVLIPTFSGVVEKSNASAALQTARSTLTNALNMSSTATLTGEDTNGYHTYILDGRYAFGYSGNELIAVDYPAQNSIPTDASYNSDTRSISQGINTIIVSNENLKTTSTENVYNLESVVATIITDVTQINEITDITKVGDTYYVNYVLDSNNEEQGNQTTYDAILLLNSDFSKKIVVLTWFAQQ